MVILGLGGDSCCTKHKEIEGVYLLEAKEGIHSVGISCEIFRKICRKLILENFKPVTKYR